MDAMGAGSTALGAVAKNSVFQRLSTTHPADEPDDDDLTYVQVTCPACAQAHLVNPKTGKVLGSEDE